MPVYKTEYMAEPFETVFIGGGLRSCDVIVAVVMGLVAMVVIDCVNVADVDVEEFNELNVCTTFGG